MFENTDLFNLSTARNPLIDDVDSIVSGKKSHNKKQSSPSSPSSPRGFRSSPLSSPKPKGDDQSDNQAENGNVEKAVPEPSASDNTLGLKDSILAEKLAVILKDTLCFDDISGDWYLQKNYLWQPVSKKRATKIISRALSTALPEGYAMSKLNAIEAFLTLNLLITEWEADKTLLPMKNGILDTKTMQLITDRSKYRFNWQLPYNYDAGASIGVILDWLNEATGNDDEAISIIRAFFKMALIGGEVQKFLELIGAGGTGKSTLARLLIACIGEHNQVTTDLKNLEGNRFEAAALYGKRLALINDSSRYGGEVSVLKAITGGDPIRFEKKNQQQGGSFVYGGVVVVASNEAIQTADYTSGLIRRRMPVVFNRKVTDDDKAKWAAIGGIETTMRRELSGLLNWVLAMTNVEVNAVIGGINGEMTKTQRYHLIETNKIAEWLDENTIVEAGAITYVGKSTSGIKDAYEIDRLVGEKLYSNYERWCKDANYHPVAFNRFSANVTDICEQLKIKVTKHKGKHGAYIRGLVLRNESHHNHKSPITKTNLSDDDLVKNEFKNTQGDDQIGLGDDRVTIKSLDSDDGDDINAVSEKYDDKERF